MRSPRLWDVRPYWRPVRKWSPEAVHLFGAYIEGRTVAQQRFFPGWASTSIGGVITGSLRGGTVLADGPAASYLALPDENGPDLLLGLLAPDAVRLPIGMCVLEGPLPVRGTAVYVGEGRITSPDCAWQPVRWWDPRPRLDVSELLAHADLLLDVVGAEPAGAFGLPPSGAPAVAAALAEADLTPAYGVLGLGPGLTPTGDDVVAGACAVLAIVGRLADSVRTAVDAHAHIRTTALSSALVAAAGRGEMIPQAARLLSSVAGGDSPARVAAAARSLFAVGSPSGHDLAAGLAGALKAAA